jgi:hypothetical protein
MKALGALSGILDKLAAHAETKATKRRPGAMHAEALLHDRLIFDQFPFLTQVQRVSDNAKNGAARLAGLEAPAFEDNEKTVDELKARMEKTIAFLKSIKPEDIVGHEEDRKISLPYWDGKHLTAFEYATEYLLPNFYFHLVTAYSILRKNGVDVGKDDYMTDLPLKDL